MSDIDDSASAKPSFYVAPFGGVYQTRIASQQKEQVSLSNANKVERAHPAFVPASSTIPGITICTHI